MAETEVTNLERQIADYEKQLGNARGAAIDQSGKTVQQRLLSDQVNTDRESYQKIVKTLNQAEISGQFKDVGALSLSDVATPPEKPVKPNKPIAAVASLMIFGILLIGLPVGWGLFDDHVMKLIRQGGSPSINIPSANQMPHIPIGQAAPVSAQNSSSQPLAAPSLSSIRPQHPPLTIPGMSQAPVLAKLPLIGSANPEAMLGQLLKPEPLGAASALHQITTNLEMQALRRSGLGGIILITSADVGEGKTVSAAALAAAFCHQGRSVFMMECNSASPTLHQWFPQACNHRSWAQDLESLRYGHTNLFLLPAHDLPVYATNELLDGYRAWIDRARQHVDWIILDGGPILRNFADVASLAPLATDVLLVNNSGISSPAKLRAALNLLQPMMSISAFRGLIVYGG
jgi:Mrp family chromosome partitioning ATPase